MIKIWRLTILHENNILKIIMLLQFCDRKISQGVMLLSSTDGISLNLVALNLFLKKCSLIRNAAVNPHHTVYTSTYITFSYTHYYIHIHIHYFFRMQAFFVDHVNVLSWINLKCLTCLLRRKWSLRFHKLLHGQVTSSTTRARNSNVNNNANLCVLFLQMVYVLNFVRIKIQNSSHAWWYYMRNSWNTQITIYYWHGSTTTVATSST